MRIVIAGGTGFIGRALAQRLYRLGYETVILTRSAATSPAGDRLPGLRHVRWDGRTADSWGALADGARAIINLAGENIGNGRWSAEKKRRILQSRLDAGRAVMEAVRQAGNKPEVLIQASAVGYYGDRGAHILTEASQSGRGFLAETARQWEETATSAQALGVRSVIVRTGVVLAPDGGVLARMLPPFRMYLGGPLGDGKQYFPWIHREDEIEAIRFLLENDSASGPYNLVAPQEADMNGFCRELAAALGRPCLLRVPAFVLRLGLGQMAEEAILASCRVRPQRLLDAGYVFQRPTLAEAFRDLRGKNGPGVC